MRHREAHDGHADALAGEAGVEEGLAAQLLDHGGCREGHEQVEGAGREVCQGDGVNPGLRCDTRGGEGRSSGGSSEAAGMGQPPGEQTEHVCPSERTQRRAVSLEGRPGGKGRGGGGRCMMWMRRKKGRGRSSREA